MLTIAYCRVSTTEQTTDNQVHEIKAAGFEPTMVFADEGVSGSMQASARPEFKKLLARRTCRTHPGPSSVRRIINPRKS